MSKLMLSVSLSALLAGCELPPLPQKVVAVKPGVYHDVPYYEANPFERQQAVAWCSNNPGLQDKNPSCDSAFTARRHAWHRELYGQQATDPTQDTLGSH